MIVVRGEVLECAGRRYRCAIGRGGISVAKREGDGVTPAGAWQLRRLLYRPDRLAAPEGALAAQALRPDDGWCDDPREDSYNRLISLPFSGSHETLWRQDHVYDVIVELGYNDDPVRSGLGSAIFLHVAKPDYGPTEGCVALGLEDLLALLEPCDETARLTVTLRPPSL